MAIKPITPCLWFDGDAEEAAKSYTSIIPNSRIVSVSHYTEAGHDVHGREAGSVMTVEFELDGRPFVALNGGPQFRFNEAISLQVECDTQEEVDEYWEKLSAGGDPAAQQCGWLKDRFGLSWQVFPRRLTEMMMDDDRERAGRVMNAMLPMKKIDLATLEKAYEG